MVVSMVDVGGKVPTRRRAVARGSLRMGRGAFRMLSTGRLPKGDALALGEAAGILGAKRAAQTIPLCHPLPIDKIAVSFDLDASLPGVHASCEVRAFAKTGVEMEALSGASAALLAVYDLVKQVDPALEITDLRLEVKEGGKSGMWRHPRSSYRARAAKLRAQPPPTHGGRRLRRGGNIRAAVITVSDRCFRRKAQDTSGAMLKKGLRSLGLSSSASRVIPDERAVISRTIQKLSRRADLVVLTGGTGLSPRDVTPEAVMSVCDRLIPGIGEALRLSGSASTPMSALSRSVAGQLGRTLVVALPGSPGGVKDGLRVLADILPHALHIARGGGHES